MSSIIQGAQTWLSGITIGVLPSLLAEPDPVELIRSHSRARKPLHNLLVELQIPSPLAGEG
jgi:hypothetical protein